MATFAQAVEIFIRASHLECSASNLGRSLGPVIGYVGLFVLSRFEFCVQAPMHQISTLSTALNVGVAIATMTTAVVLTKQPWQQQQQQQQRDGNGGGGTSSDTTVMIAPAATMQQQYRRRQCDGNGSTSSDLTTRVAATVMRR
jgi:hypothetical protein